MIPLPVRTEPFPTFLSLVCLRDPVETQNPPLPSTSSESRKRPPTLRLQKRHSPVAGSECHRCDYCSRPPSFSQSQSISSSLRTITPTRPPPSLLLPNPVLLVHITFSFCLPGLLPCLPDSTVDPVNLITDPESRSEFSGTGPLPVSASEDRQ